MSVDLQGPANAPNFTTARPADTRIFGSSDTWFKDCSSPTANDGTKLQSGWTNGILAQLRGLIRGNGNTAVPAPVVTENNADDTMLLKAVQQLIQRAQPSWVLDTSGAANTLTIAPTPAVVEYKAGLMLRVLVANTNTGASVVNASALGNKSIIRNQDGAGLQPGDMTATSIAELEYDGTAFRLLSPLPAIGTRGFRNEQVFTSSGTFTPPAGVTSVWVQCWGAGGGGGAGPDIAWAGGGGGAGGGFSEGPVAVVPGSGVTVTVGAAGAHGTTGGADGGAGGTTSFGVVLQATGGGGGKTSTSSTSTTAASGGAGSGGTANFPGSGAPNGLFLSGVNAALGGGGAGSPFGGSFTTNSFGSPLPGNMPGGGGGGGANVQNGADGATGYVRVMW